MRQLRLSVIFLSVLGFGFGCNSDAKKILGKWKCEVNQTTTDKSGTTNTIRGTVEVEYFENDRSNSQGTIEMNGAQFYVSTTDTFEFKNGKLCETVVDVHLAEPLRLDLHLHVPHLRLLAVLRGERVQGAHEVHSLEDGFNHPWVR